MRGSQELAAFTEAMQERLNDPKNAAKGSWKDEDPYVLLGKLRVEVKELADEVILADCTRPDRIRKEAADIAAYAMMVADVTGGLK